MQHTGGCNLQVAGCRLYILVLRTYALVNVGTGYSYECISPKVLSEPPDILLRVLVFPLISSFLKFLCINHMMSFVVTFCEHVFPRTVLK